MKTVLIYGGTFDPPHWGHLQTLLNVQQHFCFDEIQLVPCKIPVLKNAPEANDKDRLAMLSSFLPYDSQFQIDTCELNRNLKSYTIDTLKTYRKEHGENVSLTLLMGYDSFIHFDQWYLYQEFMRLCHILVIDRETTGSISKKIQYLLNEHLTCETSSLQHQTSGKIIRYDAGHYDISSTIIRKKIAQGESVKSLLPIPIYEYIKDHQLYR